MVNDYRFRDTLCEMLKAIWEIETFSGGLSLDEFVSDARTISATTYSLMRLSNAARSITKYANSRKKQLPSNVPWTNISSISRWLEGYKQKLSPSVIWQTVQDDVPEIAKGLRELAREYSIAIDFEKSLITRIRLTSPARILLTSNSLQSLIVPYLKAVTDLQSLIDEIFQRTEASEVPIKFITQNSPITVGINGAVEATQLIQETIIPWKKEHAQAMAKLLETEKVVEIEKKKAEVLQARALATKERAEADKLQAEITLQLEQAEKLRLENEKLRLEIKRAKVELAFEILNKLYPSLDERDKVGYLMKLLPIIDTLAASNLEMGK